MTYAVVWDHAAKKQVLRLDQDIRRRILQKVVSLEAMPRPPGALKLEGSVDVWRIRVGDYRILYTIEDDKLIVLVVKIGHRREIYR
ncbi:MAG: type II toxin-antitoxin system RelE/ParE family toxin [Magnetococcales bacterium]|nr:type II toxin-antitoxin system RelE/ParE family toxin [Magnetococcales bacterium]